MCSSSLNAIIAYFAHCQVDQRPDFQLHEVPCPRPTLCFALKCMHQVRMVICKRGLDQVFEVGEEVAEVHCSRGWLTTLRYELEKFKNYSNKMKVSSPKILFWCVTLHFRRCTTSHNMSIDCGGHWASKSIKDLHIYSSHDKLLTLKRDFKLMQPVLSYRICPKIVRTTLVLS